MLLSFKSIDNHIQRQLLKLMKYAIDEKETKRAIYLGYGVIRNHLIDIVYSSLLLQLLINAFYHFYI